MSNATKVRNHTYITINAVAAAVVVAVFAASFAAGDDLVTKLVFRVAARGLLGLQVVFNSVYLIFSKNTPQLLSKYSRWQRLIIEILLGAAGLGLVVTTLLGYGANGDPRLLWLR